ncbi:hypothetical protein BRDID11004_59910 [Bradyrhizobium diazoefficiens]|uniref:Uncharacterized protein n=1 Tax=Bradyrhizobium diazoefficiens TaxID=1355477 RepID=A0A810AK43_9BRAD|nr:hypothetical protein F07S3_29430 [Bradyrhizobium diazoefficiens]BCA10861.1 hypothetical protein BDHF08_27080 [Bradyrhizobium diazoefficiens]BCE55196.1 hypothetical protein XF5B_27080 [Bradyrhizobium diazoefficiens]BCE63930.1 hypothetical protein XF6B_27290 [Bradyrhizobium diazoefficiens]
MILHSGGEAISVTVEALKSQSLLLATPTEAPLLLLGWFWWLESRRGKPLVYARGGFGLTGFA